MNPLTTRLIDALRPLSPSLFKSHAHSPVAQKALTRREVTEATRQALALDLLSPDQLSQLLSPALTVARGPLAHALIHLGYDPRQYWAYPYQLTPKPSVASVDGGAATYIYRQAQQIRDASNLSLAFANGFSVLSPVFIRDDETLVYLELIGTRQALKANRAALLSRCATVNAGDTFHIGGAPLQLFPDDDITLLRTTLPCGWEQWAFIHRQADFTRLSRSEPFYLLDDGSPQNKATFMRFLSKSLPLPLLPTWALYLWWEGCREFLITPLDPVYGRAGWLVYPNQERWLTLIKKALAAGELTF